MKNGKMTIRNVSNQLKGHPKTYEFSIRQEGECMHFSLMVSMCQHEWSSFDRILDEYLNGVLFKNILK
jgi:hypothetical protein